MLLLLFAFLLAAIVGAWLIAASEWQPERRRVLALAIMIGGVIDWALLIDVMKGMR